MGQSIGVVVGTVTTPVLGANASRFRVEVVNDSPNIIYLNVIGGPAVVGAGIRLNANGGSYSDARAEDPIAAINAIATVAGSNLTVTEF